MKKPAELQGGWDDAATITKYCTMEGYGVVFLKGIDVVKDIIKIEGGEG